MGTGALRLFDLALATRLLSLDRAGLAAWLDAELPGLKATTRRGAAALVEELLRTLPPAMAAALPPLEEFVRHWDDLAAALAAAGSADEARDAAEAIAEKAAFGEEKIELDGRGGLDAVFHGQAPAGAVSSLALFPGSGVERYLLLGTAHLDRLLEALRHQHRPEGPRAPGGPAMSDAQVRLLARFRDRCAAQPGLRVAYLYEL
jgi:hypothetical protein